MSIGRDPYRGTVGVFSGDWSPLHTWEDPAATVDNPAATFVVQ